MSSSIPKAIFSTYNWVTDVPLEKWATLLSGTEALFYTAARRDKFHSTFKKVCTLAISYMNELQTAFNALDYASTILLSKKVLDQIQVKYSITFFERLNRLTPSMVVYPVILSCIVCIAANFIWSSLFLKNEVGENRKPFSKWGQVFQIAKVILHIAFVFFSKHPLWIAMGIVESGYSFWENHKLHWVTTEEFFEHCSNWISGFTITYHMLAIDGETPKSKSCPICYEGEPPANSYFCNNGHAFHLECSGGYISSGKENFSQGNLFFKRLETEHYQNGYTSTTYSYELTLPKKNLPTCPNCREAPRQNKFEATVFDTQRRNSFPCDVILN